jgi:hypothetical protein
MAYKYTTSKGVSYYLNTKDVVFGGGHIQPIYYFSKDLREATACDLPEGYQVTENGKGMVFLKKALKGMEAE